METSATDRRVAHSAIDHFRPLVPMAGIWAIAASVFALLVIPGDVPDRVLLLDPATTGALPWYTGLISHLGVLAWTVATTAAVGGAALAAMMERRGAMVFLRSGALLSGLLLLDDLFQLHIVLSNNTPLPKASIYVAYLGLAAAWVLTQIDEVRRTRWQLLGAAATAFAVSILIDQLGPAGNGALVAEDAAKFLGIIAWATYFVMSVRDIAASLLLRDQSRFDAPDRTAPDELVPDQLVPDQLVPDQLAPDVPVS